MLQQKQRSSPGASKRSVRGVGSQGVLAAEGRIAPWDPTPRADLTRSWSSAEVSQDLRTPKTGQGTPAASKPSLPAFQKLPEGVSVRYAPVLDCMWAGRLAEMLAVDVAVLAEG